MASINKAIIVGYLGADPEIRTTNSGTSVGTISVATTDVYTAKDGNKVENTEWHKVTVWGNQADFASKYLRKGSLVYVEGKIETRKWEDKDGATRYTTEIKAMTVQGLDRKGSAEAGDAPDAPRQKPARKPTAAVPANLDEMDDDLPF